jgi:hypothetical protein
VHRRRGRPDPANRMDRRGAGASREDPLDEGQHPVPVALLNDSSVVP